MIAYSRACYYFLFPYSWYFITANLLRNKNYENENGYLFEKSLFSSYSTFKKDSFSVSHFRLKCWINTYFWLQNQWSTWLIFLKKTTLERKTNGKCFPLDIFRHILSLPTNTHTYELTTMLDFNIFLLIIIKFKTDEKALSGFVHSEMNLLIDLLRELKKKTELS